jgi:hypothetical protein
MHASRQKRFLPVALLILVSVVAAVSLAAIPARHRMEGSSHGDGQTPKASAPRSRLGPSPTPHHCSSCPPPSPRRIYAPAIELPEAGACEIVLNSRSPHPIDVTPTLYTIDGEQVNGKPVRLQPAEIRFVQVESLVPDRYRGKRRWGGIALSYTGGILEVWAQLTFHGVGGRGSIDETFNLFEDQGSDTREAVWSMPKGSSAVLALGNSSDTPIQTTAQFSDGESDVVNIAPFATELIRRHARERQGTDADSDSVKLTTVGPAGSLRVAGFVVGGEPNFTSSIRFADPKKTVQPNLYATNLRLENTDPRLLIENTSDSRVSARPKFFPATGDQGNPIELPEIFLEPRQIVDVDLRPLTEAATTRTDLNSVSVQVLNSGAPGSLIGALYGTDKIKRLSYDVPLRDSGLMRTSTGSYPWRVDEDYTTIVNITNISDHPASFIVDIRYPTGHYFFPAKELAANGTATFDLRKLISEQKPDNQGNVIPLSTTGGQFHWSIFGAPPSSKFIGRSEVVSVSNRVSSSYSCPACCPESGPFGSIIPPDPMLVGNFRQVNTTGTIYDCNGYPTNIGSLSMDFWVDDSSIVSYSPESGGSTVVEGLASGETFINGSWYWDQWDLIDGWSQCVESRGESTDSQPVDVMPHIDSLTPSRGLAGTTVTFTINGSGLKDEDSEVSSTEVQIAGEGSGQSLDITSKTDDSDSKITVTLQIAANATEGNHSVKVVVNGQTSNAVNFYVQYPRKLIRQAFPDQYKANVSEDTTGISTLKVLTDGSVIGFDGQPMQAGGNTLTHRCGAYRLLLYQLADAEGQAIQPGSGTTVTVSESFPANEQSGNTSANQFTGSTQTNDIGYVADLNALLTPAGQCPTQAYSWTGKQHFSVTVGSGTAINLSTVVQITLSFSPPSTYTVSNSIVTQ